jgi:hypothetical protein
MGHVSSDSGHRNIVGRDLGAVLSARIGVPDDAKGALNGHCALSPRRGGDNAPSWQMLTIAEPPTGAAHQAQLKVGSALAGFGSSS